MNKELKKIKCFFKMFANFDPRSTEMREIIQKEKFK